MIWVMLLILLGTLFAPYLEMQAEWHWLLLRHWIFQTRSDVMLAQARNYLKKSDLCIRLGDNAGAAEMNAKSNALMTKVVAEREQVEAMLHHFSQKYT